jgi:hypothetical protein
MVTVALPPLATPADGVKSTVYTLGSAVACRLPTAPPLAVIMASVRPAGASEKCSVSVVGAMPLATVALVLMLTVGGAIS